MSGSYYTLNSKYNQLKSILAGLPISGSGLTADLNANNYDILNVDNIDLTTINGAAYPPVVATDDLDATLTAGNNAGTNDIDMNNQDILNVNNIDLSTINGAAYPPTITPTGYEFVNRLRYTTAGSHTFTKASYPYLRAIRVVCVGGGGGGGQTDYMAISGDAAAGTGGGGGSFAERFYTNIAGLSASVPIVVGDGGTGGIGGTAGTPNGTDATDGFSSSFGIATDAYYTLATAGRHGNRGANTTSAYGASGVGSYSGSVGDYTIRGSSSENSMSFGNGAITGTYIIANASNGANSPLGTGGDVSIARGASGSLLVFNGGDGYAFGGGGAGGAAITIGVGVSNGADGGAGARGTVWVELYA